MALELTPNELENVRASAQAETLVTVLRVDYAHDAAGAATQVLVLEAPEAIRRFGRLEAAHAARWVRSPRLAWAIGAHVLAQRARPSWTITVEIPPSAARQLMPGDAVSLNHPWIPSGMAMVIDVAEDLLAATALLTCRLAAGVAPAIQIAAQSAQFTPLPAGGLAVAYRDGITTLTIVDDAGRPLVGAQVRLDRAVTRITDAQGKVSFTAPRGQHHIDVIAAGYAPLETEFSL